MTGRLCQEQVQSATDVFCNQGVLAMFDFVRDGMCDADKRKLDRFVRSFSLQALPYKLTECDSNAHESCDMRRLVLAIGMCFYMI